MSDTNDVSTKPSNAFLDRNWDSTCALPSTSIGDAMIQQSPTTDGWICPTCKHYKGKMKCDLNIFISCVGANMSKCWGYEEGKVCRHCGKAT